MKTINYLSVLAAVSVSLGVQAEGSIKTPVVTVPKTNNIMAFNVVLTAWPNAATVIPPVQPTLGAMSIDPVVGIPDGEVGVPVDGLPIGDPVVGIPDGEIPTPVTNDLPVDPIVRIPDGEVGIPVQSLPVLRSTPLGTAVPTKTAGVAQAATVSNAPFRLTSRDLIVSLNGVTNNGVALHFGNTAQLLFKQVLSPATLVVNAFGTNRQVIVREIISKKNVDTDISRFFACKDNYVSTYPVGKNVQLHKISTLSFVNPSKLGLQLAALQTEIKDTPKTNGVSALDSLNWAAQGSGQTNGLVPNLIISGAISTGAPHLE